MPEESMPEEEVAQPDYYKSLRASEHQLELEIKSMPVSEEEAHQQLIAHLQEVLSQALAAIRAESEPDRIFAAAIQGLNQAQQEQFILENMLEAIKRGENLTEVTNRYKGLGLLPHALQMQTPIPSPDIVPDEGGFLLGLRRKLGRSSIHMLKIAMSAVELAGKFVEIVPVVGFTGPLPTISVQLRSKGASVDELFKLVTDLLDSSSSRANEPR